MFHLIIYRTQLFLQIKYNQITIAAMQKSSKQLHIKQQSSNFQHESDRKRDLFSNQSIFAMNVGSNSQKPSARIQNRLDRSMDQAVGSSIDEKNLKNVRESQESSIFNSIRQSNKSGAQTLNATKVLKDYKQRDMSTTHKKQSNSISRFNENDGSRLDLSKMKQGKKFTQIPSQQTLVTENNQLNDTASTPYRDNYQDPSRNNSIKRSDSDDRLEEWSQIFSLQHNRWKGEFDDVKARFLTDFEKQKLLKMRKPLPKSKPKANFTIPNEYLAMDKRTVRQGLEGPKERLRRDKIKARRLHNHENGEFSPDLHHDGSQATIQYRDNQQLEVGDANRQYQSQRDLESSFDVNASIDASNSLGRILYSKEERQSLPNIKLPSIHKKNLKDFQKNIGYLRQSDSAAKLASAKGSVSSHNAYNGTERPIRERNMNIQEGDGPGENHLVTPSQKQQQQQQKEQNYNPSILSEAQRFISAHNMSPEQLGDEVRQLFKSNPDGNPFKVMLDRNQYDYMNAVHERQQVINLLQNKTRSIEQAYLEAAMKRSQSERPMHELANTINLNINVTVNQYGNQEINTNKDLSGLNQLNQASMDMLQNVNVNNKLQTVGVRKNQHHAESRSGTITKNGGNYGSVQAGARNLSSKQIRISRRKMLEPLRVANKLNTLTKTVSKRVKADQELQLQNEQAETLLSFKEKMGFQKDQIGMVRKFVDRQIDNEIEKVKIQKSLEFLMKQLTKQGMTLKEVVDMHTAELYEKVNKTNVQLAPKLGEYGDPRTRFNNKSDGFDFVRILQCSASLHPLLNFQKQLKDRSKRRHQKRLADNKTRKEQFGEDEEEADLEPMAHLKKKFPQFKDQDESISYFIENIKKIIFLNVDQQKQNERVKEPKHGVMAKISASLNMNETKTSNYDWVNEPEMYQSSSGESKYSNEDKDEKDHLATDEQALLNAMRKYKNADKIAQLNEVNGNDEQTSHLVKYYQKMNHNGHIPKSFGMVNRNKGAPNELNASNVTISEVHAEAIGHSLNRAKFINKLILANAHLKDEVGTTIIKTMDMSTVRHLDISGNPGLTKNFYRELCDIIRQKECNLERIEIEGNNIGDSILHDLVEAMRESKRIVYLNVSKNNISDAGARDLALLIQECPALRLLFMHYNRVMGFGGVEIADAIAESKSLQVFDISYNSICGSGLSKKKEEMDEESKQKEEEKKAAAKKKKPKKKAPAISFGEGTKPEAKGFADLFARGFGENWSDAFASNKSLLHVDLSHNHLETNDVEIIAEGLKENQQILGIHFTGNYGEVDARGFVHPGIPLSNSSGSMYTRMQTQGNMYRMQNKDGSMHTDPEKENTVWLSSMLGGVVKDSRSLELQAHSNCWVCEGWKEQKFTYEPGVSDNNPDHDVFKPIKLHLDTDHYAGDLMMVNEANERIYEVYRMLPPGPHRYFFTIDNKLKIAQEQETTSKKEEKRQKQIKLDLTKLVIPVEDPLKSGKNSPKKGATPKGAAGSGRRVKEAEPEPEDVPEWYDLDLEKVNYIENIAQTSTIYSADEIERMNCVPRPGPKGLGNRNKVRTPWDFSLSCFAAYKPDTTRLLNDCFEMDWNRTKVLRIVKNEEEREKLKTYVRGIYKWFREMYKFTAGSDPMNDIFCIGLNVFSDLIITVIKTIVDGKCLKLSDLDLERIQTNANEQNNKFNPKNQLVRHNFLEVFLRLCDTKYLRNKFAGPEVKTMSVAFKLMFENELFPAFSQYDSHAWRKTILWQEEIDYTLKTSLEPLKAVYNRFSGKNSMPGGSQFMSLTEFQQLVTNADVFSDNFGAKQIGNQFNLSMMTQVDEIDKDRHINMLFVEFLEALVRVAENTEIPHCVTDEFNWGVDEIDPLLRETYAKRDLVTKLESCIMFVIAGNLSAGAFKKHLKTQAEFVGSGLWANDLDTGSFALNGKKT